MSSSPVSTSSGNEESTMNSSVQRFHYDDITVTIAPEKKGLFLKHSEYEIRCLKQNYCVYRRYNDFVSLHSFLLTKFPYRMVPRLPPKQLMLDSLLEERRKGLQIWLKIITGHPLLSSSPLIHVFLTDNSSDHQDKLRDAFNSDLDEFSKLSADVELPLEDQGRLAVSRENMKQMLNAVSRLRKLIDHQIQRTSSLSKDMDEISNILKMVNSSNRGIFPAQTFDPMTTGFQNISKVSDKIATIQHKSLGERFNLLFEVLTAYSDLCDRVEKGIVSEHQKALSKMLSLNRQKIKGVIRGAPTADNVTALHEQEVLQTGVVGSLGRRSSFSLACVMQETSLAEKYLQSLHSILLAFCHEESQGCGYLGNIWSKIILEESQKLNK